MIPVNKEVTLACKKSLVVLGSIPSDSHSWNLIFLQLWLAEQGFDVINLGANTPLARYEQACKRECPGLCVISSLNGHLSIEGPVIAKAMSYWVEPSPLLVAGGKLSTSEATYPGVAAHLKAAGFAELFWGTDAMTSFRSFLKGRNLLPGAPDLPFTDPGVGSLDRVGSTKSDLGKEG